VISKTFGALLILATVAAGAWVDIAWLLVGGIAEIIRGAEAHPVSGHDIGWGAAHVVLTGVGIFAAVLLGILWAALFLGRSPRRRTVKR
jgi:hypothetical protein